MRLLRRRDVILGAGTLALGTFAGGGYAVAVEPFMVPKVTRYALQPPTWPAELALRIAVVADIHACEPWMSAERVRGIAEQTNALGCDLIVLLGDFNGGHNVVTRAVMPREWADALSILRAPLGVLAILGNHDWWHGAIPSLPGGAADVRRALLGIGVRVLENDSVALWKDGRRFFVAGLADQMAHRIGPRSTRGADDLAGTLKAVGEADPVIVLAHEPFVFRRMPNRVALTLCGHTHGGQVRLPVIGPPFTPSRRYAYGHVVDNGRHVIVSGGLGESGLPVRLGVPPEILEVSLCGLPAA